MKVKVIVITHVELNEADYPDVHSEAEQTIHRCIDGRQNWPKEIYVTACDESET